MYCVNDLSCIEASDEFFCRALLMWYGVVDVFDDRCGIIVPLSFCPIVSSPSMGVRMGMNEVEFNTALTQHWVFIFFVMCSMQRG